jgi:hypothetical protein
MEYYVEDVIKHLEKVKKAGVTLLSKDALIRVATPRINDIDRQMGFIEKGIEDLYDTNPFRDGRFGGIPKWEFYRHCCTGCCYLVNPY